VSGTYGYLVRFSAHGASKQSPQIHDLLLTTIFQLNPRTLPALTPGDNELQYRSGKDARTELPIRAERLNQFASSIKNASYEDQGGQGYVINHGSKPGEVILEVAAQKNGDLTGFDAGGRFLDLRQGIAPNKLTAEVRQVTPWPSKTAGPGAASISWSTSSKGPWTMLWTYNPKLTWLDGQPIKQVLRWPEVDRSVRNLPQGTRRVYVRYQFQGLAIDHFRLASIRPENPSASQHLVVTHIWDENGVARKFSKSIQPANVAQQYDVNIPAQAKVSNVALVLECPPK
jgi:hypothetical protein